MNLNFANTLYFKKENILEIILGLHRSYKYLQREIETCCELNNLTYKELLVLLEIKKGFKKKIEIANKVYLKKQNLNLILKDLQFKKMVTNDNKRIIITDIGLEMLDKTTNRINEKVIKIFQKTDPKNMAGFINIIESL